MQRLRRDRLRRAWTPLLPLRGDGSGVIESFLEALRDDRRPLLTREEEAALGRRIKAGGPEGVAAHGELVERNLRLAVSVAKKHRNRGLDFEELVQAASLGVMHAAHKYDPEQGWKFSTYCTWWCRHEVGRALQNTSRTIRLTAPVHADLQLIRKAERALLTRSADPITAQALAVEASLTPERVEEVLAFSRPTVSLHVPVGIDGDEFGDLIASNEIEPPDEVASQIEEVALATALRSLPYRQRRVVIMRHGLAGEAEHTLDQCAAVFRVQREQVRILQARAETQLREVLS